MDLLILGGTGFVGRHLTTEALSRGHRVTLFNRGRTGPALFPNVETVVGDRREGFGSLPRRSWDAVIDTHAQAPGEARRAVDEIAGSLHVFISSVSAYDFGVTTEIDEDSPLATSEANLDEDRSPGTYGARKAAAERAVLAHKGGLILRPGLIVGPHDPTDRFTYWPVRVAEGGDVLAPPNPDDLASFIDVRDLAEWMIRLIERRQTGVFNVFDTRPTFRELLETCRNVCNPDAKIRWVPQELLEAEGVAPWSDLPLWAPGLPPLSNRRAREAGLVFRPLSETVAATLEWARQAGRHRPLRAGLSAEREARILALATERQS